MTWAISSHSASSVRSGEPCPFDRSGLGKAGGCTPSVAAHTHHPVRLKRQSIDGGDGAPCSTNSNLVLG
jgi:hypothetical protein